MGQAGPLAHIDFNAPIFRLVDFVSRRNSLSAALALRAEDARVVAGEADGDEAHHEPGSMGSPKRCLRRLIY